MCHAVSPTAWSPSWSWSSIRTRRPCLHALPAAAREALERTGSDDARRACGSRGRSAAEGGVRGEAGREGRGAGRGGHMHRRRDASCAVGNCRGGRGEAAREENGGRGGPRRSRPPPGGGSRRLWRSWTGIPSMCPPAPASRSQGWTRQALRVGYEGGRCSDNWCWAGSVRLSLAIARCDSRDGYRWYHLEAHYVAARLPARSR